MINREDMLELTRRMTLYQLLNSHDDNSIIETMNEIL